MNLMYDLICRRPENNNSQSVGNSGKSGKNKVKQGTSSARKEIKGGSSQRDQIQLLTPIDHTTAAKNIYLGQVRINPKLSMQLSQKPNPPPTQTKVFYRTLQKNAQTILTTKNVWDLDGVTQSALPDQKNQDPQGSQEENRGTENNPKNNNNNNLLFVQSSEASNNINIAQSDINQNTTNSNINSIIPSQINNANESYNPPNQPIDMKNERILAIQTDGNQIIQTVSSRPDKELEEGETNGYNFDTALNNELCQRSINSINTMNCSNNQFRISKSKNGLRTPKYGNQKQALAIQEEKKIIYGQQKEQNKSKSQQRNRTQRATQQPNSKYQKPDTYEMLREAQNRLKILQQSRYNNYSDLKSINLKESKGIQGYQDQPLTEISNISYERNMIVINQNQKPKQLQKQQTQHLPPQINISQQFVDIRKRGSCIAKISPAVQKGSKQIDLLQQYSVQKIEINGKINEESQKQTDLSQNQQQQLQTSQFYSNMGKYITEDNDSHSLFTQQPLQQFSSNNINLPQTFETQNAPSRVPYPHLVHAQSSNLDVIKNQQLNTLDQTKVLNCPRKQVSISDEDKKIYGDRFIDGYQKINLLGKGGFALVWLAKSFKTGLRVAVKQICKQNGSDSHMRESRINQQFFDEEGQVKEYFQQFPGIDNILKCFEIKHTPRDIFMIYELGGGSLSSILYEIKGEFYKSERVYKINFTGLHDKLFQTKNNNLLHSLMKNFFNVLDLLQQQKIVHCDVKPENILVELDSQEDSFEKVHLIDFGSCFSLRDTGSIGMATPEYLAPEVLEIFAQRFSSTAQRSQIEQLAKVTHPWSVDMWSMGAVMLEILTGLPHWLGYKCRIVDKQGRSNLKYGLFSTKGQDYDKIIQKQQQFCDNFNGLVKEITKQFECPSTGKKFQDLLKKMMKFNPNERISPQQALQHSFFMLPNSASDISNADGSNLKLEN